MPGPSPGMDPYLEDPAWWAGWHATFVPFVMVDLNRLLPPRYVANVEERLYLVEVDRDIFPDVDVRTNRPDAANHPGNGLHSAAPELAGDPPVLPAVEPEEVRELYVDIVSASDQSKIITTIEVLSPTNKPAHHTGRRKYREKQRAVLASSTHLLEIDLLRKGEHTVVAPLGRLRGRFNHDYLVCLSRGGQRQVCEVWPIGLRNRLPRIRVPLAKGDADLVYDLQATFDRCYDDAVYARRLRYSDEPAVPLSAPDSQGRSNCCETRTIGNSVSDDAS